MLELVDRYHEGHGGVAGGTSAEESVAAARQHQFFDQFDDEAASGGCLGVSVDQGRAEVVDSVVGQLELPAEVEVVHREGVVSLDGLHVANVDVGLVEGGFGRGHDGLRHQVNRNEKVWFSRNGYYGPGHGDELAQSRT